MSDIYEQHRASFQQVSAYVILKGAERVATIAFKFPRDGAGRLYAYVHWLGLEMVRGSASGGGYDKRSAACADAARKMITYCQKAENASARDRAMVDGIGSFLNGLERDAGETWESQLRTAGFTVLQAV